MKKLITSLTTPAEDEGVNILFLDLEGVMTKGMLGAPPVSMVQLFHYMSGNTAICGNYSKEALRYVERLVGRHNFRIVLITRHGNNDAQILQDRLDHAGIKAEWLYHDPDAIGAGSKDEGLRDWLQRNRDISLKRMILLEDQPEKITVIPKDRIVGTDPDKGFTRADFLRVLEIMGLTDPIYDLKSGGTATGPQGPRAPRA